MSEQGKFEKPANAMTLWRKRQKEAEGLDEDFGALSDDERLVYVYKELTRKLTIESHPKFIDPINWEDKASIALRKAKLSNLKDLVGVVNGMMNIVERIDSVTHDKDKSARQKAREEKISHQQGLVSEEERKEMLELIKGAEKHLKKGTA